MTSLTILIAGLLRVLPGHLGALHRVEAMLALVLAAAPFVVLAIVISIRRRQDLAEEIAETSADHEGGF